MITQPDIEISDEVEEKPFDTPFAIFFSLLKFEVLINNKNYDH